MIEYFKELLNTLKSINTHLNELRKTEQNSNEYLSKISNCVKVNRHGHGDKYSISTKHWND